MPWDKLPDFVRGVVVPLRGDATDLDVIVLINALSQSGGFKQSTLDQKVRGTLSQIGVEVLEDRVT